MDSRPEHYLWVEKYRPRKIEDCILPDDLKKLFKGYADAKEVPNLVLSGSTGTGKTTVARALCDEVGAEMLFVNGSEDSGIDTVRTKIRNFASTSGLMSDLKVVLIDEADYMNINSAQPALRAMIEEFNVAVRFILTCNYKDRLMTALTSRSVNVEFRFAKEDEAVLSTRFFKRVMQILAAENVQVSDKAILAELIKKYYPDFRRTLNELQRFASGGVIDAAALSFMSEVRMKKLMTSLKSKDFNQIRKWSVENCDSDPQRLYGIIFDNLEEYLVKQSLPEAIWVLADYQKNAAFAANQELNLMACLLELSTKCQYK